MRPILLIVTLLLVLLIGPTVLAKEWRTIVPLRSTRSDVERLLGSPRIRRKDLSVYELAGERVSFEFASGSCSEPQSWSVPADTVVRISVEPKPHQLHLEDLKLDETRFKKVQDPEVGWIMHYTNNLDGIKYEVDVSARNEIVFIEYYWKQEDESLRCVRIKGRA